MEIVFQHPWMLVFLLLIPLLFILHYYFFEHNKLRAMKFSNFAAMKRVTGTTLITKNRSQLALRLIIVFLIVMSASGPTVWYKGKESIQDFVIAIDSSASMVSQDVSPDRITVAKQAASQFVDSLDADANIGLVSFAGVSLIKSPLTDSKFDIKNEIDNIEIELAGGTDIGAALVTATNLMAHSSKAKAVILMTDGSDTSGSFVEDSLNVGLEYVAMNQVVVYVIGIGTGLSKAGYIPDTELRATLDKQTYQEISSRTGGKFYEVTNTAELAAVFQDIEVEVQEADVPLEMSFVLLGVAAILLLAEWGLLNTKFRAIP